MTNEQLASRCLPKGFETLKRARKRSLRRQERLWAMKTTECDALADKLAGCRPKRPCESAACPVCFREYRLNLIRQVVRLCSSKRKWRSATLIYYSELMTDEQLASWDARNLMSGLRNRFRRANLCGPVIGGLEVDCRMDQQGSTNQGRWLAHFHLLVPNEKEGIKALKHMFQKDAAGIDWAKGKREPSRFQRLRNPERQVSYCFKTWWAKVYRYNDETRTNKVELPKKQLALSLMKMDELGFTGLRFLQALRISGPLLKPTLSSIKTAKLKEFRVKKGKSRRK